MLRHFFKLLGLSFFLVGCAVVPVQVSKSKERELSSLLQKLDTSLPKHVSLRLSRDIFEKTVVLAQEFEVTSPPLWHNTLVNMGLREKGLCYHWSDALYAHLKSRGYRGFEFHFLGADIGTYFEHNAVAVTVKGKRVEEAIILDAWRASGTLYFSKVKYDTRYTWSHRAERGCN